MMEEKISEIFNNILNPHPLSYGITKNNVTQLIADYLAMSEFFPYIQAGAHNAVLNKCLTEKTHIPESCQATSVVGAFLCWDEFGGHYKMLRGGIPALPTILETKSFHANILKEDIKLFSPNSLNLSYSQVTADYLLKLQSGLSSENPVERVAFMVAFERNAEKMIMGLYDSLKNLYSLKSQKLAYFETHVGGDDPAEAYHIETTTRLIAGVVNDANRSSFLDYFTTACYINREWTEDIKGNLEADMGTGIKGTNAKNVDLVEASY